MNGYAIQTGDWVGSAWGTSPHYTPYAQAIADHYPVQVPWFLTLPMVAASSVPFVQTTHPYQHDVLILGAAAFVPGTGAADFGNLISLNITHQETGIPWAAPNKLGVFPLLSLAGVGSDTLGLTAMPVMRLPEAFFLPARTRLKITWFKLPAPATAGQAVLTLIGVQLVNPRNGRAPEKVIMPDGKEINVGDRLPWFATLPMGEYQSRAIEDFVLAAGAQVTQFLPPQDCAVEIHDAYSNTVNFDPTPMNLVTVKLTDMGAQTHWTPNPAPVKAVFGGENQVNPDMPFTKPYLLLKGHRIQITMQNNNTVGGITRATLTLRGVRLCEY